MSTQTKWTPGPWTACPGNNLYAWEVLSAEHNGAQTILYQGSGEHSEANARLISIAPEAIEALRSIAENLTNRAMSKEQEIAFAHNPQAEQWRVYLSSLIIQARNEASAILAKLEGGAK